MDENLKFIKNSAFSKEHNFKVIFLSILPWAQVADARLLFPAASSASRPRPRRRGKSRTCRSPRSRRSGSPRPRSRRCSSRSGLSWPAPSTTATPGCDSGRVNVWFLITFHPFFGCWIVKLAGYSFKRFSSFDWWSFCFYFEN